MVSLKIVVTGNNRIQLCIPFLNLPVPSCSNVFIHSPCRLCAAGSAGSSAHAQQGESVDVEHFTRCSISYGRCGVHPCFATGTSSVTRELLLLKILICLCLSQRNLHQLEKLYWERTNPNHEDFAKWLTIEEINDLVAPPQDEVRFAKMIG